jgi:hypothetical protein
MKPGFFELNLAGQVFYHVGHCFKPSALVWHPFTDTHTHTHIFSPLKFQQCTVMQYIYKNTDKYNNHSKSCAVDTKLL